MITLQSPWEWWALKPSATSQKVLFQAQAHDSTTDTVGMFGGVLAMDRVVLDKGIGDTAMFAILRFFDSMWEGNDIVNMSHPTMLQLIAKKAAPMFYSLQEDDPHGRVLLRPEEWLQQEKFTGVTLMDPDGWDRQNFEADWAIPISETDMDKKIRMSTVIINRK